MPPTIINAIQKFTLFILNLFVVFSCGQISPGHDAKKDYGALSSDDEITPDIKKVRQEYILSYKHPKEFEARSKGINNEVLRIYGRYYCLFDSAVVIPGRYNYDDTSIAFVTHNFAEDVAVISNGDTILKKTISKKDFINQLARPLKDYAVMFEPKFDGYDSDADSFDFELSVSIPVTDLGHSFSFSIQRDGKVNVRDHE